MPAFNTVPYNFTGGTYQSRTRNVSDQRTINMYQQLNELAKDAFVLYSFPGQSLTSTVTDGDDRGAHDMNSVAYRIVGNTLYSIDSFGAHTDRGVIDGVNRCIMSDDGENLVIVADTKVYVYNSFSETLVINTNINLVNVLSVTIINNQFIYTTENLSFMAQPGQPENVSGLDAIGAESNPDKLVRDYVFNQTIYRFGVKTTEPWYNTDTGKPPIDRIDGQQFSIGLGAIHSLTNTDRALYWLGDDHAIYRVSGGINERISDDGLSNTIERMTKIDDAHAYAITLQGQDFYIINFPSENRTFAVNESLGKAGWFELRSFKDQSYSATSALLIYGKTYLASRGKWLTLELDEYTQDSDVTIRERIGLPITRKNVPPAGIKGRALHLSRVEFVVETGIGLITGQGEDPKLIVDFSTDGGVSFADEQWVDLGRLGDRVLNVQADVNIVADEIIPRVRISDPVPLTISATLIDVKEVRR